MYHYLFTNDLRISSLESTLKKTGECFVTDTVPSASENKSENNNMMTLGFYFNLTHESNCAKACADGQVREVVLNFIKKFQFPNVRTKESYNDSKNDGITLAPLRLIMQTLYLMNLKEQRNEAFLTRDEICNFIFYNADAAKVERPDVDHLISQILEYRKTKTLPESVEQDEEKRNWKHGDRQLREMIKVLTWSGCVTEGENESIRIHHDSLTPQLKAAVFDILTSFQHWNPDNTSDFNEIKKSYQDYMDIEYESTAVNKEKTMLEEYEAMDPDERKQAFIAWMKQKSKSGASVPVNEDDYYSENVVYNYANFLTNRAEQLSDFPYEHTNLFWYVDPDEFAEVMEVIMADPKYPEVNQKCISKGFGPAMKRYKEFLESLRAGDDGSVDEEEDFEMINYHTGYKSDFSLNRIVFGAPGTGKSFTVKKDAKKLLGEGNEDDYERVTFHPDYSYANFVGTYKPVMVANEPKWSADKDTDYVVSILKDDGKAAQEKYDLLFERFRGDGLTRLPILLGLYTDESFKTKKQDGTDAANDNSVERNHGRAIRKYVNLISDIENKGNIAYEYVPGPFMRVYVNALKSARTGNPKPHLLIIEEINRANVAAVFGDIFQLLDRDDENISEYPIQASEDIKNYLAKELGGKPDDYRKIRIPDNMFIWATMNSADQGVFPMDTAFKRRWDFTYLGIDDCDADIRGKYVTVGSKEQQHIEWNSLRKSINDFLAAERINEDKQLGPYFISRSIVVPPDGSDEIDSKQFCNVFKSKVLMYLFEDAAKQKRTKLFEGSAKGQSRYSQICAAFDEQGIGIFNSSIQTGVTVQGLKTNGNDPDENDMVKTEE